MALVKLKSAWKKLEVDRSLLVQDEFQSFGGLEVLENYELLGDVQNEGSFENQEVNKLKKKKKDSAKKKKLLSKAVDSSHAVDHRKIDERNSKKSRNAVKSKLSKKEAVPPAKAKCTAVNGPEQSSSDCEDESKSYSIESVSLSAAMVAWKDLFVPLPVLRALHGAGFLAPTLIQSLVLPSAIRDRKDILGAAETGSGKTLAFGIPLLHRILEMKASGHVVHGEGKEGNESHDGSVDAEENSRSKCAEEDENDAANDDSDDPNETYQQQEEDAVDQGKHVYALVVTPTRELAVQVRDHLNAAAKYTGIKAVAIFGGMASQKQERLLRRCPEIVVGTPGRLWELYSAGQPHLTTICRAPLLVVDEADRMVERGHFEELSKLLSAMSGENHINQRQTMVFSATLTYVHDAPSRMKVKRKKIKLDKEHKLAGLMETLGMSKKPKIIDVTRPSQTAQTLLETRILCRTQEKDHYLYYFLQQHPGRSIVFANSIDSIRRLVSILTLLRCNPLPLHSEMHQKQRLKNLERFAADRRATLLATDVAARGLDIPGIDHVVHFQVPRTCESYVHRSGRTARACKEGLSIMMIDEIGVGSYRKLVKALNKGEDLPIFPIEHDLLQMYKERVDLARQVDVVEHSLIKKKKANDWFVKAAEEADLVLDDVVSKDAVDEHEKAVSRSRLRGLKERLGDLLSAPVGSAKFCGRYPTMSGKLVLPLAHSAAGNPNSAMSLVKRRRKE